MSAALAAIAPPSSNCRGRGEIGGDLDDAARAEMVAEPGRGTCGGWLDEAANVVAGAPSIDAPFPAPATQTAFNRILKKGVFPKGLRPTGDEPDERTGRRLRRASAWKALGRFDGECRRRVASGQHVVSTGFVRCRSKTWWYSAMHTRHHCKQMSGAA